MNNFEYIEAYLNDAISPQGKMEFEKRVLTDPEFAEDIAFYFSSRQMGGIEQQDKKERFRQIYEQYKTDQHQEVQRPGLIKKFWPWAAAAAVLVCVVFAWNAWIRPESPKELAENYIARQFQTLPVMMNNGGDSLQAGLQLYNEGRFTQALAMFESLAVGDAYNYEAEKYAGIVSLQLNQYDKALQYFTQLENQKGLYVNPGKFYQALTLMKRNRTGDKVAARDLLQQVVELDLEGKEYAQKWLKKW